MITEGEIRAAGTGGFQAPDILGAPGSFTFTELDPPKGHKASTCSAWAVSPPIVVAGYGGWSRVARPRKIALTEWVGRDAMSIEIEFLIDAFAMFDVRFPGVFVEGHIRAMERMAGVDDDDPEPPLLEVTSVPEKLIPHNERRASHVKWFLDQLTWDRATIITLDNGNRVRAGGTVTITQFVEDERLATKSAIQKRNAGKSTRGAKRKTYTVKRGDSLSKIAARKDVYGDASKWKRIATANHIRDPKRLTVGKELKIP